MGVMVGRDARWARERESREGVMVVTFGRELLYRVSGTETVAGGRARRRATPGKVCILESHHVSGAESEIDFDEHFLL